MSKVSVVVPVYNVEPYIARCTKSLMEQTYSNIEYIFVDDCSQDHSVEVLQSVIDQYPERKNNVTIIRNQSNQGLEIARQNGNKIAKGKYIASVDSDDWIETTMIALMVERAETSGADIVVCDFYNENTNGTTTICEDYVSSNSSDWWIDMYINDRTYSSLCNKLYRRELFERITYPKPNISQAEDWWANIQLYYFAKSIVRVPIPLYHYVICRTNSISSIKTERHFRDATIFWQRVDGFLSQHALTDELCATTEWLKLRQKAQLMLAVRDRHSRAKFYTMFDDIDYRKYHNRLRLGDKIALWLSHHRLFGMIGIFRSLLLLKGKLQNKR